MPDDTTVVPAAAPAAVADPPADPPPPAPAAAAADPEAEPKPNTPEWFNNRLERERRKIYKEATGEKVPKDKTVAAFLAEKKAAEEKAKASKKEAREAEAKKLAALEAELANSSETKAAIRVYAEAELAKLTDKQREAVKAVAADSPTKQLETISAWRIAGLLDAAPAAAPAPVPAKAPVSPANTAQPPAPTPGAPSVDIPVLERWAQLQNSPPSTQRTIAMTLMALEHGYEILEKAKPL